MNTKFDQAIRDAMQALEPRTVLDDKIGAGIRRRDRNVGASRRLLLVAAVGACATVIAVLAPSRAEAVLQRIAGSLDDVAELSMTRSTVLADGTLKPYQKTIYSRGKWRMEDGSSHTIYKDGVSYTYDRNLNIYRRVSEPDGPFAHNTKGIGLSSILNADAWSPDTKVTVSEGVRSGRNVLSASLENPRERIVIYADRKTELPIEAEVSTATSRWRTVEILTFDYPKATPASAFELASGVKVVTESEANALIAGMMTNQTLGSLKTKSGQFVLRQVDVAKDGTVFVTYQAGDRSMSWAGFRLTITDDLGTEYAAPAERAMSMEDRRRMTASKDGRIDQEIFVPVNPNEGWRSRTITISCHTFEGEVVRFIYGFSKYPDGSWEFKKFPNNVGATGSDQIRREQILTRRFVEPTCELFPSYMPVLDPQCTSALRWKILQADHLATRALNFADFPTAARWLERAIALKAEASRAGEGPYATDEQQTQLEAIRSGSLTRPPALR